MEECEQARRKYKVGGHSQNYFWYWIIKKKVEFIDVGLTVIYFMKKGKRPFTPQTQIITFKCFENFNSGNKNSEIQEIKLLGRKGSRSRIYRISCFVHLRIHSAWAYSYKQGFVYFYACTMNSLYSILVVLPFQVENTPRFLLLQ